MTEYKSFFKTVKGNEGQKCHYATRLDTYGCGCSHDCKYCYAKSLLEFRGLWRPQDPSVADIKKIEKKIETLNKGSIVRLGGMTDCFQPCETEYNVTYDTIKLLNKYGIHYLIVTKSNLVASNRFLNVLDRDLAHIQITVTSTDDRKALEYENASPSSERIRAIERLYAEGFDVSVRVSPFIPEYIDFDILNNIRCNKILVEFLRVNKSIKDLFQLDYSLYTHKENNYYHLPLEIKKQLIRRITGFEQMSVCEDCSEAYNYWKTNVNYNPSDCCNLKFSKDKNKYFGDLTLLNKRKVGFLSSQKSGAHTADMVKAWVKSLADDICVMSGFQSKIEKTLLDMLLAENRKIIMVLPRDIFEKCPQRYKNTVKNGQMLIISPFDLDSSKTTRDSARIRNQFVIDAVEQLVIGDLSEGGMLDGLLTDKRYTLLGERIQ